jgi:predicted aldo/keto reductase-like oxidoreductase
MKTDRLDLIQLHGIDDTNTLRKAMSKNGSLEMCKKARNEGIVDFIGITSHKPRVLIEAIETNEFDTILVPLNVVTRQALEELIPRAKELDVGVAIMKPLSAKTSRLVTCLYNPSLSLISNEPDLKVLLGSTPDSMVDSALRFVLAQDVSVIVTGFKSVAEVEVAAKIGTNYSGLNAQEKNRFNANLDEDYCRDCGLCLPCPQDLDIAAVLRFYTLSTVYGLKGWAKRLYSGLEVNVDNCTDCGQCETKCPYNLPVVSSLHKAKVDLASLVS